MFVSKKKPIEFGSCIKKGPLYQKWHRSKLELIKNDFNWRRCNADGLLVGFVADGKRNQNEKVSIAKGFDCVGFAEDGRQLQQENKTKPGGQCWRIRIVLSNASQLLKGIFLC